MPILVAVIARQGYWLVMPRSGAAPERQEVMVGLEAETVAEAHTDRRT